MEEYPEERAVEAWCFASAMLVTLGFVPSEAEQQYDRPYVESDALATASYGAVEHEASRLIHRQAKRGGACIAPQLTPSTGRQRLFPELPIRPRGHRGAVRRATAVASILALPATAACHRRTGSRAKAARRALLIPVGAR